MPRARPSEMPIAMGAEGDFEARHVEWGGMNAAHQVLTPLDCTEIFATLPGGHCEVPHWGYVIEGSFRCKYGDHEETYAAGDLYFLAPGHIPVIDERAVVVEFSPAADYAAMLGHLGMA